MNESLFPAVHHEVIDFVMEHIIHRFGIPQTLTMDQGAAFMLGQFREFVKDQTIKFLTILRAS
jgi:hypothetical protein